MFVLPGYDAFLGFLLIARAVPVLALVTNKLLSPSSQLGEELTYESGMEPVLAPGFNSAPLLHVRSGLRHLRCGLSFSIPGPWRSTASGCWPSSRLWCSSPSQRSPPLLAWGALVELIHDLIHDRSAMAGIHPPSRLCVICAKPVVDLAYVRPYRHADLSENVFSPVLMTCTTGPG